MNRANDDPEHSRSKTYRFGQWFGDHQRIVVDDITHRQKACKSEEASICSSSYAVLTAPSTSTQSARPRSSASKSMQHHGTWLFSFRQHFFCFLALLFFRFSRLAYTGDTNDTHALPPRRWKRGQCIIMYVFGNPMTGVSRSFLVFFLVWGLGWD